MEYNSKQLPYLIKSAIAEYFSPTYKKQHETYSLENTGLSLKEEESQKGRQLPKSAIWSTYNIDLVKLTKNFNFTI